MRSGESILVVAPAVLDVLTPLRSQARGGTCAWHGVELERFWPHFSGEDAPWSGHVSVASSSAWSLAVMSVQREC